VRSVDEARLRPNAEQAKQRLGDSQSKCMRAATASSCASRHTARKDGRGVEVEFDVKVPPTAVELPLSRRHPGDECQRRSSARTASAVIWRRRHARLASAKTVSGDITLTKAGADAQLSLSTVSGDLLGADAHGPRST
jgi:hypothetical protein